MDLEKALKKAAYKVWNELSIVPTTNDYKIFNVREEALTTMALKELYKSKCSKIEKIIMISGHEENLRGYDFELVIGSRARGKYIRMFVQAKRIFGDELISSYNSLHFQQTEDLLKYSKKNASLAMYAFFNNINEQNKRLENFYNSSTTFDRKSLGITLCSAYSVDMKKSKHFNEYHFNNGIRVKPSIYSLRNFPDLFYYHSGSRNNLAVPFHEIAYMRIELAELMNKLFKRIKAKSKYTRLNYYYYFPPGLENLFEGNDNLIPILHTNVNELENDFRKRTEKKMIESYNPQALIIVDTDEIKEKV